jgi:hypothetical protein
MNPKTLRALGIATLAGAVACTGSPAPPEITVVVSPASADVAPSRNVQFTATVTGIVNQGVTWSVQEPSGGTITPAGLYTAPPTGGTYHVLAASVVDRTRTGSATVSVAAGADVTVSPSTVGVPAGQTQQFTATVGGSPSTAVTWSVQEAGGGTITAQGLYTAPATSGTYHVVAANAADPTRTASALVYGLPANVCGLEPPQPTALPAARVIELGTHTVGDTVTFAVPADTGSVTLLQQGVNQLAARTVTFNGALVDNTVIPLTVNVDGTLFYDDLVIPPDDPADWGTPDGIGSIFSFIPMPWTGVMTVPNTSNMLDHVARTGGVPAGTWSVVVNDYAEECKNIAPPDTCVVGDGVQTYPQGTYDVKVLLRPGAIPSTGTVDVALYLVTDELTASSAPASPDVQRMLQTLATYLGRAGIALGTVEYVDMAPAVKAQYATVDVFDLGTCGDVATLLRMTGPGNRMNLMLVKSFSIADVVGIDGTIPGPGSVGGTVASGALVSAVDLSSGRASCGGAIDLAGCGADLTAYIAAHEAGHFLGLYHVTESDGTLFDPVRDTPTCPCASCSSTPGACATFQAQVTVLNCTRQLSDPASPCGGGDNLMFWLVDPAGSTGTLSPQQSSIARANPVVR